MNLVLNLKKNVFRAKWVLYPYLLAIFPILALFSGNVGKVSTGALFVPFLIAIVLTETVALGLRILVQDADKHGIILSVLIVFFWYFDHLFDVFRLILGPDLSGYRVIFLMCGVLGGVGAIWGLRRVDQMSFSCSKVTGVLNPAIVAMVAASIIWIGWQMASVSRLDVEEQVFTAELREDGRAHPSILYVMLDAYGGHEVIKDMYGVDNSEFLEGLEARGFTVLRKNRANYNLTPYCMASMLNMSLLNDEASKLGGDILPEMLIKENLVFRQLKSLGYRIGIFHSDLSLLLKGYADDVYRTGLVLDEFWTTLSSGTPLRFVFTLMGERHRGKLGEFAPVYDLHRDEILYQFETLENFEIEEEPYFLFAHIMSPHWPPVFTREGEPYYPQTEFTVNVHVPNWKAPDMEVYEQGYADQVVAVNRMTLKMLDGFIARNPDTLIILMGDHGPRRSALWDLGMSREERADEELPILNAWRYPDWLEGEVPGENGHPVNTFRVVFNELFDAGLEMIEPRHFIFTYPSDEHPQEVTEWVVNGGVGE